MKYGANWEQVPTTDPLIQRIAAANQLIDAGVAAAGITDGSADRILFFAADGTATAADFRNEDGTSSVGLSYSSNTLNSRKVFGSDPTTYGILHPQTNEAGIARTGHWIKTEPVVLYEESGPEISRDDGRDVTLHRVLGQLLESAGIDPEQLDLSVSETTD